MNSNPGQSGFESSIHSRFYPLEPEKERQVESLTSYVVRLADMHGLITGDMVVTEIAPAFQGKGMDKNGHCDIVGKASSGLNGLGGWAEKGVRIVEDLTRCANLDRLTLLPLRDLISPRSTVRTHSAWCPLCLAEWRNADATVYSPLAWHFSPVRSCPSHPSSLLVNTCPHCLRQHFPLSRWSAPGHCPKCMKWLAVPLDDKLKASPVEMAVSMEASRLLEATLRAGCRPNRAIFLKHLRFLQDQLYKGSLSGFARAVGLNDSSILALVGGKSRPGLETVLRISVVTDVPTPKLVGLPLQESDLRVDIAARKPFIFPARSCRAHQWNQVREMVRQAASAQNPTSLSSLCKRAGLDPGLVSRRLPKEASVLIERALAVRSSLKEERLQQAKLDIHRAVCRCFEEKKPLCHTTLESLMKKPGCFRSPELRAYRDQLIQLAQRGELPKLELAR